MAKVTISADEQIDVKVNIEEVVRLESGASQEFDVPSNGVVKIWPTAGYVEQVDPSEGKETS